jgi:dihydrofolate synthase/folylpolyglutamate synthase
MITLDGQAISDEDLEACLDQIEEASLEIIKDGFRHPTSFEVMTAAAFLHFVSHGEIALIETGMGGRLDATNVMARPLLCLVSPIGMDHEAFLGSTIEAIAGEKAGIFRPEVPVISAPQNPEAAAVLAGAAETLATSIRWIKTDDIQINHGKGRLAFDYKDASYKSALLGSHQTVNAALALEAASLLKKLGWKLDAEDIKRGIAKAVWPGRFEVLRQEPLLILDGAHNAQGMKALNEARKEAFEGSFAAVVGVLGEKDMGEDFKEILRSAARVLTVTPKSPRALAANDLAKRLEAMGVKAKAMADASDLAEVVLGMDMPCLVFGSLYLIGPLRAEIAGRLKGDQI